jgi:Xaa-Pro aminopeptidase
MKKFTIFIFVFVLCVSGFSPEILADDDGANKSPKVIRVAPPAPQFTTAERHNELAERRKKVANSMADNSILIMFSADSKIYTNDVDYHYRQENNLYYLTALRQNGAMLVMMKNSGKVSEFLFLPKRNPQAETWNGRMYSNEDANRLSGITNIVDARFFGEFLTSIKEKQPFQKEGESFTNSFIPANVYLLQGSLREFGKENKFADSLKGYSVRNALPIFSKLRLQKSPYEIKIMQHSIDITSEALMRSMGMIGRADYEYEVQAEVEYTFRRRNANFWGYPSIVGCGPNATTLHYIESQGKINKGDLMLMDVGAEYDHYTADITRTFPVNGKFSKEQAEIYQIVYDAQESAAATLKPGASMRDASRAASGTIQEGLAKLGLITEKNGTVDISVSGQIRQYPQVALWYMHGWGHWLGMNVHDVGNNGVTFAEGMIMTNEPGIYIREDALDYLPDTPANKAFLARVKPVFDKYKNIGVRIEDNMLITKTGVEWLSKGLPRTIKDVEAFMAKAQKEMSGYASVRKDINPHLGVFEPGGKKLNPGNQTGFLMPFENLNGKTLRSGWKNPKTIQKHYH